MLKDPTPLPLFAKFRNTGPSQFAGHPCHAAGQRRRRACVFSRLGAMESISSMNMMAGAFFSASSNALRRLDSLSPAHCHTHLAL